MSNFSTIVVLTFLLFIAADPVVFAKGKEAEAQLKKIERLIETAKYDEAISLARSLENALPDKAELLSVEGLAFMYKGDTKNAKLAAESALNLDQKNYKAHVVLANIYARNGMADKSQEEFLLSVKYRTKDNACTPCLKASSELKKRLKQMQNSLKPASVEKTRN